MLEFYLSLLETEEEKTKFERIFIEYKSFMKYFALGILKNEYDAEEAFSQSIFKIMNHLDGVDEVPSHKTKAFIVIIVRNICYDMLDKRKRNILCGYEEIENECAVQPEAYDVVRVSELIKIIDELPEIHRDIISMKAYYDKSDREIAKLLNISNQTYRKRLQRARKAFEKLLLERGEYNVYF